jgi:hypothetical protein
VGRFLQPGRPSVHLKVAVCTPRPGAVSKASDTLKGVGDESEPPSSGGVASSGMAGAALICLAPCPWQSVVVDADRSCRPAWQRLALSRPDHHVLGCRTLDATTQPQWASGTPAESEESSHRHSSRRDGLAIARRLHVSLARRASTNDPRDATPAITTPILRLASILSRLSASLRPHSGLTALTGSRSSRGMAFT